MRSQILSKNEDAVAIPDGDLHVTLASGSGWQDMRKRVKASDFDEPEFKIDIEPSFKVLEKGGKKSWYVRMKDQRNWKENSGQRMGFIAQEVQKELPFLVSTNGNGNLAVKYQSLIPLLIEAVKELSNKVKELEEKENAA